MGGILGGPSSPNPYKTASAQNSANISTAVANAFLGNVNQITPYGSLNYNPTSSYSWTDHTDPKHPVDYQIPIFTATQSLTPEGQQLQDLTIGTQTNLGTLASNQSAALLPYFASGLDLSQGAIGGRTPAFSMDPARAAGTFALSPDAIAGQGVGDFSYGPGSPGFSLGQSGIDARALSPLQLGNDATESRLFELGSARLDPLFSRQEDTLRQRLADQGIQQGSDAFSRAMQDFGQTKNDAYNQLLLQGRAQASGELQAEQGSREQVRQNAISEMLAQSGEGRAVQGLYGDQALAAYNANLGGRQQAVNELMAALSGNVDLRNQVGNQLLQEYQTNLGGRQQSIDELLTMRNQPLNEITALMSGSQVRQPSFVSTSMPTIPTTDVAGIINQGYLNDLSSWQNGMGALTGGLFQLGSAYLGAQ